MARLTGPYHGFTGDSSRRTTTAEFPLGTIAQAEYGKEYAYVQCNGGVIAGSAVKLASAAGTGAYDVVYATNANEFIFGVAEEAFADNEYGWVCVRGVTTCRLTDATAAGSPLGTTTADGILGLIDATAFGGRYAISLTADANSDTVPVAIYLA